ncbi:MAG: TerC family protein [Sphingobacteriaceae bacterium]
MTSEFIFFTCFLLFIGAMLAIDLGVFNKKQHSVSFKEAAIMSAIWVSLALAFYVLLLFKGNCLHHIESLAQLQELTKSYGQYLPQYAHDFTSSLQHYRQNLALEFITGYVVEYALSVDNIFVMVLIFSAFAVEEKYYHRVLFWGIIGALCLRFLFIFIGASLLAHFSWVMYLFGAFLIYTGAAMFFGRNDDESLDPENHKVVKFAAKYFPVAAEYGGGNFFIKQAGKWFITPLFIVLLVIEFTDLLFAVDSIPAIFSVTKDPYIVFFSNIFAILGLRSMFFLLVNSIHKFHYLKTGLSILLIFIGFKMLGQHYLSQWGFSTLHSLVIILLILSASVIASLLFPKKES